MPTVYVSYVLYWEGGSGYAPVFDPPTVFEGGISVEGDPRLYGTLTADDPAAVIATAVAKWDMKEESEIPTTRQQQIVDLLDDYEPTKPIADAVAMNIVGKSDGEVRQILGQMLVGPWMNDYTYYTKLGDYDSADIAWAQAVAIRAEIDSTFPES